MKVAVVAVEVAAPVVAELGALVMVCMVVDVPSVAVL